MGSTMAKMMKRTATISKKPVKYSPQESKLLDLLAHGNITTSDELAEQLYDGEQAPYHARSSVTSILRTLIDKIDHNKEPFIISKTRPSGPHATQYQKVPRPKSRRA